MIPHFFGPAGETALHKVLQLDPLLAFDFDGTLAPIADTPDAARMPSELALGLAELAALRNVAIVTGRAVADVATKLDFKPRFIIGNHGAEDPRGELPGGTLARLQPLRELLQSASARLTQSGVTLEDKRYSLALHYRRAPDPVRAQQCIAELLRAADDGLFIFQGKCVINVAPADAPDKADAVFSLVHRTGAGAAVFVGDDANDEPVFERAPAHWLTVRVGTDPTHSRANFALDSPQQVGALVQRMVAMVKVRALG